MISAYPEYQLPLVTIDLELTYTQAQFETPRQVIPAKSLTRDEVFTRFDLKSVIDGQGQHVIPKWDPPGAPGICSEWLGEPGLQPKP